MATIAPIPKVVFFGNDGNPLAAGKVYTYAAGTSSPQDTYTDATGTATNTNPVILDSRGEASIWLGTGSYKFVIRDLNGVLIYTTDNISPPTDTLGAVTFSNKTLDNTNIVTLKDDKFTLQDNFDTTKQVKFEVSGVSTSTTRTLTVPNQSGVLFINSLATSRLLGRTTAGTGVAEELTVGAGLTLSAGALVASPVAATTSLAGAVELATQTEATEFAASVVPTANVLETIFKNEQIFTASGTFTKPTGVTKVYVEVQGAGGGGGGATIAAGTCGSGGGGGGYSAGWSTISGNVAVTIGAGGAGVSGGTGNTGGTSSFAASGGTLSSTGGTGGSADSGTYGIGGSGSGGTLNTTGGCGDQGEPTRKGGAGGVSFFGGSGVGATPSFNANGGAGTYGGGGGGATSNGAGAFVGGAGGAGLVYVRW